MLRQDSIHSSADIRSKGSPFRAKCHEIFCCPLKQAIHKESSEPEGLCFTPHTPLPLLLADFALGCLFVLFHSFLGLLLLLS